MGVKECFFENLIISVFPSCRSDFFEQLINIVFLSDIIVFFMYYCHTFHWIKSFNWMFCMFHHTNNEGKCNVNRLLSSKHLQEDLIHDRPHAIRWNQFTFVKKFLFFTLTQKLMIFSNLLCILNFFCDNFNFSYQCCNISLQNVEFIVSKIMK